MKNFFNFIGIATLVVVIGFLMIGCEIDDGDDGNGYLLNGVWSRGDIVVTFNGRNGVFTQINSDSNWQPFLNNGTVRIGDRKFQNIIYQNNLTWTGQEMGYTIGTFNTVWSDTTITMHINDNTIRVVSPDFTENNVTNYYRQ